MCFASRARSTHGRTGRGTRARLLREHLGWSESHPAGDVAQLFEAALGGEVFRGVVSSGSQRLEAAAQRDGYVIAGQRPRRLERFLLCRVLHHAAFVAGPGASRRLITRGNDWQQAASRAFAAELLAPAEALRSRLTGADWDARDRLADDLDVSPSVIAHQIENHRLA